jgi:hypothetical protein
MFDSEKLSGRLPCIIQTDEGHQGVLSYIKNCEVDIQRVHRKGLSGSRLSEAGYTEPSPPGSVDEIRDLKLAKISGEILSLAYLFCTNSLDPDDLIEMARIIAVKVNNNGYLGEIPHNYLTEYGQTLWGLRMVYKIGHDIKNNNFLLPQSTTPQPSPVIIDTVFTNNPATLPISADLVMI